MPPIPSTPVAERSLVAWHTCEIRLRDGALIDVRAQVQTELRIALGPTSSSKVIGPLLEFRNRLDIEDMDGRSILPHWRYSGGAETIRAVLIEDEWQEIEDFYFDAIPEDGIPLAKLAHPDLYEPYYYAWDAVSAARLREILDPDDPPGGVRFYGYSWLPDVPRGDLPITRFPFGTAAFDLSVQLLSGTLEAALTKECRRLRQMLDDHLGARKDAILRAEAKAEARWSQGGAA
jgi:hypothetical protein